MDLDDYLENQNKIGRDQIIAKYLNITEDELDQVFDGHIEDDLINDEVLNGYIVYFIDDASKEITNKIKGYVEGGNYVWIPTTIFDTPDEEY